MCRTTVLATCFGAVLVAGTLATFGSVANADTFKFYKGTNYPSYDPYYGSAAYNAIDLAAGMTCPTIGTCSSDNTQASLSFTSYGGSNISLTVSANGNNGVWDDLSPNYGGLGVSSPSYTNGVKGTGDDQIDPGQTLTFTFGTAVNLIGVLNLFDRSHRPFNGNLAGNIIINDKTVSLADANGDNLNGLFNGVTKLVFAVGPAYNGSTGDPEYYVSGLEVTAVPLPATVWLFASGLGALGLLRWRKQRKPVALSA